VGQLKLLHSGFSNPQPSLQRLFLLFGSLSGLVYTVILFFGKPGNMIGNLTRRLALGDLFPCNKRLCAKAKGMATIEANSKVTPTVALNIFMTF
jgi:hypothetical protein